MAMEPRQLTESLSVCAQIAVEDLAAVAQAGFRSVINNRPDHEVPGQPENGDLLDAATTAGLAYRYLPVISGQITDAGVRDFSRLLTELPPPTLAFCRTGTRCTVLWALAASHLRDVDEIVQVAKVAGYDLEPLRPRLRQPAGSQ